MATKKKAKASKSAGKKATSSKSLKKKTKSVKKSASKKASAPAKPSARKKASAKKAVSRKASRSTATSPRASKKSAGGGAAKKKASSRKAGRKPTPARREQPPKRRLSTFADAVKLYESGVRLMHQEKYDQARAEFNRLNSEYPNETELLDRANVLIQVCENRLQDDEPRLKGGNEYYDVGVAEMNDGNLDAAGEHLEQALKLLPTADHVLYALGALFALRGDREQALDYLSRSIERRTENRFQAANDADFATLVDDPEFIALLSSKRS